MQEQAEVVKIIGFSGGDHIFPSPPDSSDGIGEDLFMAEMDAIMAAWTPKPPSEGWRLHKKEWFCENNCLSCDMSDPVSKSCRKNGINMVSHWVKSHPC
ncbi:MAG: hypothetical protein COW18_06280 [Zetaproteobacteria bacterium CG12_big_fil_rev_8_21_14_0_65_54_13]|nr:MAG: hypothetical protein COW18_06280 [Zetaproteobacteria bacterium CG12_big_fil_rev_8_21_14_0_65_54_13]PIX53382.1 MAG: hypothetical protein COZ50_13570 [Zetaproteobacteria bacterium CG_4_10_14_3_um_filter_54_28]PJA29300.1 MAG: hypothetical protein CO188_06925 [Zetaproteobacteria bacterium CG_4_9_14_3_um_filter_54_145]